MYAFTRKAQIRLKTLPGQIIDEQTFLLNLAKKADQDVNLLLFSPQVFAL